VQDTTKRTAIFRHLRAKVTIIGVKSYAKQSVEPEFGSNSVKLSWVNSFLGPMNGLWNALAKVGNKAQLKR
jgi:hypothetical protein